ncbi:MAG: MoaD/ThiS family protein [Chloroflexota bacterium]
MITVEVWLYGPLSQYGGERDRGSHAQLQMDLPEGSKMEDLLHRLRLPMEEKGITFINAQLTDMPGLAADLEWELRQGDRVGIFHRQSMWPFQYRHGASLSPELREAMKRQEGGALRHSPRSDKRDE